jgi:hypothetical protein
MLSFFVRPGRFHLLKRRRAEAIRLNANKTNATAYRSLRNHSLVGQKPRDKEHNTPRGRKSPGSEISLMPDALCQQRRKTTNANSPAQNANCG